MKLVNAKVRKLQCEYEPIHHGLLMKIHGNPWK